MEDKVTILISKNHQKQLIDCKYLHGYNGRREKQVSKSHQKQLIDCKYLHGYNGSRSKQVSRPG
jgi:hypothetical protein